MSVLKGRVSKSRIEQLQAGQKLWDTEIAGFYVYRRKSKTNYCYKYRVNRVQKVAYLGLAGSMTLDDARAKARQFYLLSKDGIDPEAYLKREAEKIQLAIRRDSYTVGDAYADWEKNIKPQLKPISLAKWTYYGRYVAPTFGKRPLSSITTAEINEFHRSIKKPYAANGSIQVLKKLYRVAVMLEKFDGRQPFIAVKLHPEQPRRRHLTGDEPRRLFLALEAYKSQGEEEFKAACCVMLYLLTSARKSEWLNTPKEWVDLKARTLCLPDTKNGEPDTKILPTAAIEILKLLFARYPDSPWIFPSPKKKATMLKGGAPLKGIKRHWNKIRTMAGMDDLRIHDLRRSFASFALTSGYSLHQIGEILNHKNVQTTKGYAYMLNSEKQAATEKIAQNILGRMKKQSLRELFHRSR